MLWNAELIHGVGEVVDMKKATQAFSENSRTWSEHFSANLNHMDHVPWEQDVAITEFERTSISQSIATFQLGENAEGKSFRRAGRAYVERTGDEFYIPALKQFIEEEQRHSQVLGRFMKSQKIPFLAKEWSNTSFRWVRKLAGLNICITVLLTAEIIAAVYYRALGNATASPVLRAICGQILIDEAHHLNFQAGTLAKDRYQWSSFRRGLFEQFHRLFLCLTIAIVWISHRAVFRAGNYGFFRMVSETWSTLEEVLQTIRHSSQTLEFPGPSQTTLSAYDRLPSANTFTNTSAKTPDISAVA